MALIVAVGEVLIDFTPYKEKWGFLANPGGSAANFLAQLSILGQKTAFMGMVGKDQFGAYLRTTLDSVNINTEGLLCHQDIPTTLAFVHIKEDGDRSFTFYRSPGADMMYSPSDINYELIDKSQVLHFSGVSLTKEPMRSAALKAAAYAGKKGVTISFDANYRKPLWESEEEALRCLREALPLVDVLKVSDDEAILLSGKDDVWEAAEWLKEKGASLVFVTMGPKGCICCHDNLKEHFYTYDTKVVDTTGSGDSFLGAAIAKIIEANCKIEDLTAEALSAISDFANAAGACCASGFGAIPSLKDEKAIIECMKTTSKKQDKTSD
ncbi:carbohydrate kinase family protein [Anaeropeptidivorans aminofermentans]|uniref:carbohydrate kinase family protein n=1 Tax=Anaeropeptidivorans aminofermentans TaxID=2934315 RepID=UPI0020256012|nr:carbohydrate kinase [Anaeropeptidivorans aminofermentans]MBE6012838.1 carbohydrate kinase [Lachnospiraceae bacterium]